MINTSQFSTNINIKCPARLVLYTGSCTSCPGIVGDSRLTEPGCSRQVCWIACWCFIIFSKCPPCDSQCECGLLFVFVFVMHFYIVQVPGLTVVLHRVVTSLTSGNCSHPLAVIKPLFTFMQMEFAAISVNCSHPDVLFPLFFCKWSIMAPIQMNSFLFHANGVCLHFFHFHKKSIVLTWHFSLLEVFQIRDKRKKEQHEKERQANIQVGRGIKCKFKSVWKGKCKTYSRLESILWTSSLIELPPIN